jgi:hypothetical protein
MTLWLRRQPERFRWEMVLDRLLFAFSLTGLVVAGAMIVVLFA